MTAADQIYALIYELVPLAISLVGFIIGLVYILKKKSPYFFTLIIFGVGCFLIALVSVAINTACEVYVNVGVGMLGLFGCNLFLLSANFGALDKVVDETGLSVHKKMLSLITPVIFAAFTITLFLVWKDRDMMCAVVYSLALVPAIPASYFNTKHLLIGKDDFGFLKAIRACDIMSLVFYSMTVAYLLIVASNSVSAIVIAAVAYSVSAFGLALSAVKGIRQWKI